MKLDLPLGLGEERMLLRPGAITYRKKKKENEPLSQAPRVSGGKNAPETQEARKIKRRKRKMSRWVKLHGSQEKKMRQRPKKREK